MGKGRTLSAGLYTCNTIVPSSDVRSSETSAQNARGKNFQKFTCLNFRGFVFHGSYFHILVVGRENRENLDLAKISCYMVLASCSGLIGKEKWPGNEATCIHIHYVYSDPHLRHVDVTLSLPVFKM